MTDDSTFNSLIFSMHFKIAKPSAVNMDEFIGNLYLIENSSSGQYIADPT